MNHNSSIKFKFSVAGLYSKYTILEDFIILLQQHPEWKREESEFDSIYGSFPHIMLNGGRFVSGNCSFSIIEKIIRFFTDKKIAIKYTFSNLLATEEYLQDFRTNFVLKIAHRPENGIITDNPIIEKYVRKNYPQYKIIASCTTLNHNLDYIKNRIQEVDLFTLQPELNKNYDLINKINCPEKLQLLVSETCIPYCPLREKHYNIISKAALLDIRNVPDFKCLYEREGKNFYDDENPLVCKFSDLLEIYKNTGIIHFKLTGREKTGEYISIYIDILSEYFIKEKHKGDFYRTIYKNFCKTIYKKY